jgi:hypothetical protein
VSKYGNPVQTLCSQRPIIIIAEGYADTQRSDPSLPYLDSPTSVERGSENVESVADSGGNNKSSQPGIWKRLIDR